MLKVLAKHKANATAAAAAMAVLWKSLPPVESRRSQVTCPPSEESVCKLVLLVANPALELHITDVAVARFGCMLLARVVNIWACLDTRIPMNDCGMTAEDMFFAEDEEDFDPIFNLTTMPYGYVDSDEEEDPDLKYEMIDRRLRSLSKRGAGRFHATIHEAMMHHHAMGDESMISAVGSLLPWLLPESKTDGATSTLRWNINKNLALARKAAPSTAGAAVVSSSAGAAAGAAGR